MQRESDISRPGAPGGEDRGSVEGRKVLRFFVRSEEYAVDLTQVQEVVRFERATRLPRVPDWVAGVVNLRGIVLPVIDLSMALGGEATPVTGLTCLLVVSADLGGEHSPVGLLVEEVSRVSSIADGDIEPPPPFGTTLPRWCLTGMARSDAGFLYVLDLVCLFAEGPLRELRAPLALPIELGSPRQVTR